MGMDVTKQTAYADAKRKENLKQGRQQRPRGRGKKIKTAYADAKRTENLTQGRQQCSENK